MTSLSSSQSVNECTLKPVSTPLTQHCQFWPWTAMPPPLRTGIPSPDMILLKTGGYCSWCKFHPSLCAIRPASLSKSNGLYRAFQVLPQKKSIAIWKWRRLGDTSVSWKIVHEKNNWFRVTFVVYNSRYLFFKFYLFFLDKNYNPQLVHWGKGKSTPFILLLVSWKSANILPSISSIKYSLIHWNQSQGVYLSNHSNYFLMK